MKTKMILFVLVVLAVSGGIVWMAAHHPSASTADASGRKVLYYTCSMHPWVREHKPGPCPVCGMNLTPVYASESGGTASADTNSVSGTVTLESESISTINVQTDMVTNRPVRRTVHLSGEISWNSWTAAWFEFTAYERDCNGSKSGRLLTSVFHPRPTKFIAHKSNSTARRHLRIEIST